MSVISELMNREHWWSDTGRENPEYSKHFSHCHFAQQKFRMDWSGIETELLRWQAVDHVCTVEGSVRNFYISFPVRNVMTVNLGPSRLTFLSLPDPVMPHVIDCNILRRKKWMEIEGVS